MSRIDGWRLDATPVDAYLSWARERGVLFAQPDWSGLAQALDATPAYAWNEIYGFGAMLARFRRQGLRIGVLGLPVAGPPWDAMDARDAYAHGREIARLARVDLVRINLSMRRGWNEADGATAARPEAWIENLPDWYASNSKRLRKDLAFARRAAGITLSIDPADADPHACFDLYAATLGTRGARVRYTVEYFQELVRIARTADRLRIVTARRGHQVCGFAVLARCCDEGFYLHGGTDAEAKRDGVSDLLLDAIVAEARIAGAHRFSLMASPWDPPGLLRYKQKWSNATGVAVTLDLARTPLGKSATWVSRWLSRADRRHARQGVPA